MGSVFEGVGEYGVSMNYFAIMLRGMEGTSRHVGHVREITYEVNPCFRGRGSCRTVDRDGAVSCGGTLQLDAMRL